MNIRASVISCWKQLTTINNVAHVAMMVIRIQMYQCKNDAKNNDSTTMLFLIGCFDIEKKEIVSMSENNLHCFKVIFEL